MKKKYQAVLFSESGSFVYSRSLGVHRIANVLREHFGWDVLIIDHFTVTVCIEEFKNQLLQEILPAVLSEDTRFIGFSTTFMNIGNKWLIENLPQKSNKFIKHPVVKGNVECLPFIDDDEALDFLSYLKTLAPNSKTVIGGVKAESRRYKKHVDAYVIGYGESQLIDLINFWQGKNPFMPVKKLAEGCLEISHDTKGTGYDFSSVPTTYNQDDLIQPGEVLPIEISRGCIFRCKFCSYPLNGKKKWDYIKDSKILKEEFLKNYEQFGTTKYIVVDDTFNDSVEKLKIFNDVVQSLPFKIQYGAYIRHDLLAAHPESEQLLRDSGLISATFGIETLNYESGKSIGKGMHPDKTLEFLTQLRNRWPELITSSGFILGLPHDTKQTIEEMCQRITSKGFPLDGVTIVPLWLDKNSRDTKLYFSEFESNWELYDYKFGKNPIEWSKGDLTYKHCLDTALKYQALVFETHRNKVSTFEAMSAMNFGLTSTELKQTSQKEFSNGFYFKRVDYVQRYLTSLKELVTSK